MSTQQLLLGEGAGSREVLGIEDVFSTYLATGAGTSFTIDNGIDLSTKGGMAWMKRRSSTQDNYVFDTVRGAGKALITNDTIAQYNSSQIDSFTTTGFTGSFLASGSTNVFWSFRKQPKFFDVVSWTGNGAVRNISHNLGSVPGCIIVKCTTDTGGTNWMVYHRSLSNTEAMLLNSTAAVYTGITAWDSTTPTSTVFTVAGEGSVNASGESYVAYIFAHDAGGFGLTGTDNVISCGSFTTNGSGNAAVNLGWEPQYVLYKKSNSDGQWYIEDTMRGLYAPSQVGATLIANLSNAEGAGNGSLWLNSTGFTVNPAMNLGTSTTYIYIAIRRGPMKVPTDATKVYYGLARSGNSSTTTVAGGGFPLDLLITQIRNTGSAASIGWMDRLRGPSNYVVSNANFSEGSNAEITTAFPNDGYVVGPDYGMGFINNGSYTYANQMFRRAPSVFDIVCYTGNSVDDRAIPHNLTVAPSLVIYKRRNSSADWVVLSSMFPNGGDALFLQSTAAISSNAYGAVPRPTATNFYVRDWGALNNSGDTYVAYLFATCAGVSKAGSYTGTGTTKQIDCGFAAGARFVMIKRTDSTGDWYYWDTARGIVSGNDPYLRLNNNGAEVTSTDYIDPYSAGFELSSTAPAAINANGGTFIFLAIA